ncbi:MAG: BREX-2 system adenine-specific DNA-methyltransferase PglX [Planctomycetota bacterium]
MIDRSHLLTDLRKVVPKLEEDLRLRLEQHEPSRDKMQGEYAAARRAGRTAAAWEVFRDEHVTQVAVAWVLATVFVRFVEDNGLVDEPWLGGPKLQLIKDRYTHWQRQHLHDNDRDYLLHVFAELGRLPGLRPLLAEDGHSLVWSLGLTADGARLLREFWLGAGGDVVHDFTDPQWSTRFLGDLYQDLSEHAQKKYALLQTPEFIEEFLLDKTLEPALAEFGLRETRIIDPACGSGHFLLGSFARLFAKWQKAEPAAKAPVLAQRALDAVAGVDLNPFAVAIARFRLLVAALKVCGVRRLKDAFDFRPQVANGDSLLHGPSRSGSSGVRQKSMYAEEEAEFEHVYASEDKELLHAIFRRSYHAVVGNPPYIVARDRALNRLYRERWPEVCYRKYSLGVPFTQLFFELARPKLDEKRAPGFVGMITANSFMKREFGKKLIEEYLGGKVELTGVLDLSGAYIPGHGTPTVILLGRTRTAVGTTIRAVLGIKGEPSTPDDPSRGLVWSAIVEQFERPGSESEFVSCADVARDRFAAHPWSIGGGGAAELKEQIEEACEATLKKVVASVGVMAVTGEDDAYTRPHPSDMRRLGLSAVHERVFCEGDVVRDWTLQTSVRCFFPYGADWEPTSDAVVDKALWSVRAMLQQGIYFGQTKQQRGMHWWEYGIVVKGALRTPLSIAFAEVASHNHFVLDRGGKVFKQTAPVIKLPPEATEDDHLGLLGLLNSSVACFWLKQVCHNKGSTVDQHGARQRTAPFEDFYQHNASRVAEIPIAARRPLRRARALDHTCSNVVSVLFDVDLRVGEQIEAARRSFKRDLGNAIELQEELDWECYRLYGLIQDDLTYCGDDLPGLELGQRAFEIVLARQVAAGKTTTTWFDRHGSTKVTEIPAHWPKPYRDLVQRRIECIENNPDIRLIEQPEYKRRWNIEPFQKQLNRAQRHWLLDRLEAPHFWSEPRLTTTARFAELLRKDTDFVQVANLYRGRDDYDFDALVRELVTDEGVPFLPVQRYKPSGLRKREVWERTWDLQRREDAGEDVGQIPVPPKYTSADFLPGSWRHRGKLDVPKERFVLYPQAEANDDPSPVFTWAGFDHLQQAKALAAWLIDRKEQDGWTADKLRPLYAGLDQLIPWLKQWHNDVDPETQQRLGDYFQGFLDQELRAQGLTIDDVCRWSPPARGRGRPRNVRGAEDEDVGGGMR